MAIALNNILQFTAVQSFLGQQLLNVYHYEVSALSGTLTLEECAQAFEAQVIAEIIDLQSTSLQYTFVIAKDLTDGVDIWEEPVAYAGTDPTSALAPSFESIGFRLVRSTGITRHGSKRIGGLGDNTVSGNTIAAGVSAAVAAAETAMGAVVSVVGGSGTGDLSPVIVGRYPIGHVDAGELDLSKINPVASVKAIRVTTQTTRRAGRGS